MTELIFVCPGEHIINDGSFWQRQSSLTEQGFSSGLRLKEKLIKHNKFDGIDSVSYPSSLNYAFEMAQALGLEHHSNANADYELDPSKGSDELDGLGEQARSYTLSQINEALPGYLPAYGYLIAASLISQMTKRSRQKGVVILPEPCLSMTLWALDRNQQSIPIGSRRGPGTAICIQLSLVGRKGICYSEL